MKSYEDCFFRVYEYEFYYNNELLKADKCDSTYHGNSYCIINGITYENVAYKQTYVDCNDDEFMNKSKDTKDSRIIMIESLIPIIIFFVVIAATISIVRDTLYILK